MSTKSNATWSMILKIIIAVATAIGSVIGVSACINA
ncbi:MAG: smalltalk protein [Bacteroidales bacterium]|nr:smalltalk protein [Bacteroidales bacterium]